jgi:hypothetical protein
MAHGKDYVPTKDAEFDAWFKFLIQYVAKKCSIIPPATAAEWTHIPAEVRAALGIPNHDAIPSPIKPTTRTRFTLRFEEPEQGKTVYIALCWQSESGKRGDYSELQSAVIP